MKMLYVGICIGIIIGAVLLMVVACCVNAGNISRRVYEWSNKDGW